MTPLPDIVYIEINAHGDPQTLIQKRADGCASDPGVYYLRIYDVFGDVGGVRTLDADGPQARFYLRTAEDVDGDLRIAPNGLACPNTAFWGIADHLVGDGEFFGTDRLARPPDLCAFWERAEFEEGSGG